MLRDIRGRIVPGHGRATGWLSDGVLADAIGKDLFDGTINFLAVDPANEHRIFYQDLAPGRLKSAGRVLYCPCTLNGHDAFIIATWEGARPVPQRPGFEIKIPGTTLIEVVAEQRIEGVAYGTDAELRYDPAHTQTRWI